MEMRAHIQVSQNYITVLFSGNKKVCTPEVVINNATKVARKFIKGKKKDAQNKEQKEAILLRDAKERETKQMRRHLLQRFLEDKDLSQVTKEHLKKHILR